MSQTEASRPFAVLYQATPPPVIDGIRKPMKPGGYVDSGADIAYVMGRSGAEVVTPEVDPDPTVDDHWAFPDTDEGIAAARDAGAEVLWANTVLFSGHPIERAIATGALVVGQKPAAVHRHDDKWLTNNDLREAGCPVARSILVGDASAGGVPVDELDHAVIENAGLSFPLVVKPVRGRGSQGVTRVSTLDRLVAVADELLAETVEVDGKTYPKYGTTAIVEEYLDGVEVTMTVMPPGTYLFDGTGRSIAEHWSLPAVERFNHVEGITPYNGVVAVTLNSRVADPDPALDELARFCTIAGGVVGAVAPIRIDCRARPDGSFAMFDLNMKPNMTGAGRPGRDDQDSLSCMAARSIGWSYAELLVNMLLQAWADPSATTA